MTASASERITLIRAYQAVEAAIARCDLETPHLAAPDGRISVKVEDARALVEETRHLMNLIAVGRQRWIGRWYGSEPERGQSVHVVTKHGTHGEMIAHLGDAEGVHEAADALIAAHNAALISEGVPT